jgi:hypothetical protein
LVHGSAEGGAVGAMEERSKCSMSALHPFATEFRHPRTSLEPRFFFVLASD